MFRYTHTFGREWECNLIGGNWLPESAGQCVDACKHMAARLTESETLVSLHCAWSI